MTLIVQLSTGKPIHSSTQLISANHLSKKGLEIPWYLFIQLFHSILCLAPYSSHVYATVLIGTTRYLFDPDSGPFLSSLDCEQSVTIGCLIQLRQSLELLNLTTQGNTFEIDVAKGSYSLLPYANQHWASHLRACLDLKHKIPPGLTSQIEALSESISLLEQDSDETTLADSWKPIDGDAILSQSWSPKALKLVTQFAREPEGQYRNSFHFTSESPSVLMRMG